MNYMILLAGGIGSRTKLDYPKQYHKIDGNSIINFLLSNIENELDCIIIVCDPKYQKNIKNNDKFVFVENGKTRLESLQNGLKRIFEVCKNGDLVFIHEAARILLDKKDIDLHKKYSKINQGLVTGNIVFDTMFKIDKNNQITEVIKKQNIMSGFNPQSFYFDNLLEFKNDILNEKEDLDLCEILVNKGFKIQVINQISNLKKITIKDDLDWIEEVIKWEKK